MYINIYICMYMYTCIYSYMYLYIIFIFIYRCTYLFKYQYIYVYSYTSTYACTYPYLCIRIYIYIDIYIHIYKYTHPNIGGFIFIFVYAQMYVCVCVFYHLTQVVYIVIIYVPVAFESLGHHHRSQIRTADTDVYYLWHVVKHTYVYVWVKHTWRVRESGPTDADIYYLYHLVKHTYTRVSEAPADREREQSWYLLPVSSSKAHIYMCESTIYMRTCVHMKTYRERAISLMLMFTMGWLQSVGSIKL